jgi:integrase
VCDVSNVKVKQPDRNMRVLSRLEQEKLSRHLIANPGMYNTGILVCLFTGLRVGEICALSWEDVSFDDKIIHVRHTLQRVQNKPGSNPKTRLSITSPKSPKSVRFIPIPDNLFPVICKHKCASDGFFLTNSCEKCVEPRNMQGNFERVLDECGIEPANFHALRHTFATRCIELGMDVKSLSEILGHSNVTITMNRYVHPSMELKRKNMNLLSKLFPDS